VLKRLDFSENALGDEGAQAAARFAAPGAARELNVEYNSKVSAEVQQRARERFGPYREERLTLEARRTSEGGWFPRWN